MEKEFAKAMPKLGFGLMRLPRINKVTDEIDIEQTKKMVDMFLDAGLKYFDTAFVYNGSEAACKQALVDRYPRESYYLASKLNASAYACHDEESAKQEFYTSLERTGAGYFDFYLLHALSKSNIDKYEEYHIWDFVQEQKAKGLIKHVGFSFHDTADVLESILQAHPEVEFVQLQLNYADWESPTVQSRLCYEVCEKYGKPVVVMEPVKGGTLADPPLPVKEILTKAEPDMSPASWAIRYIASLPNVMVVLSGMSSIEQMADNTSYMKDFTGMTEMEQETIRNAQKALNEIPQIPCTACRYCVDGCPMQIRIPDIFAAMNREMIFSQTEAAKRAYANATKEPHGKASECIQCGACEGACPQHLPIRDLLVKCAEALEN